MTATLKVFVQPRSSRNTIVGWQGDELKVALTAPPVDGAANAALIDFLADALGLKRRQLSVAKGETSRHKTLTIEAESEDWRQRLPDLPTTPSVSP